MESGTPGARGRALRIGLVFLLVAAVAALFASGVHRELRLETVRDVVREAGPLGAVLFVLAFACLQPLFVSAHLFVTAAALVWPPPLAFALSWVGALASSHVAFGTARYLGRDFVQPRIPERIRRYESLFSEGGLRAIVVMKLVFFTSPALQWAYGISRVPVRTFALGTAIGNTPTIAVVTALAAGLDSVLFS